MAAEHPIELWLQRIHLRSVGPPAARFDPLDLRFDVPGQTPERVLLSLTNGGGKTTLIRLVSSVLVPHGNRQVGGANIGEYVASGDTSHIVTEWGTADGDRLLIGAVYEWPNRTQPAGAPISQLRRHFYLFRSSTVTVDDLPFDITDDQGRRRRRTRADFIARVRQLDPARVVETESQTQWGDALAAGTPIDTELFHHQMRMNDTEAGAGQFVKQFDTDDKLVRFFVDVLTDDDTLESFAATLAQYAAAARNRANYEAERGFFTTIGAKLATFAQHHQAVVAAHQARQSKIGQAGTLHAALAARADADIAELDSMTARRDQTEAERVRLTTEINRREDRRAELRYVDAQLRLTAATGELSRTRAAETAAQLERDAWQAVPTILKLHHATGRHAAAQQAFGAAEGKLAPLAEQQHAAGAALAAKFRDLADQHLREAGAADAAAADAHADAQAATAQVAAANRKLSEAERDVRDAEAKQTALADTTAALRASGHLDAHEMPAAGLARHQAFIAEAHDLLDAAETNVAHAAVRARDTAEAARQGDRRLVELTQKHTAALDVRAEFDRALSRVSADAGVAEIAERPVSGLAEAERLIPVAEQLADQHELAAASARREIAELEALIVAVSAGGLAPTAADIETVRAALDDAGVAARTGYEWLAENLDTDACREFIAAHPDLANAVVVISDVTHPGGVAGIVEAAGVELRSSVVFATPHDMVSPPGHDERPVAVAHPAVHDRAAATMALTAARTQSDAHAETAETARQAGTRTRQAAAALSGLLAEWSDRPPELLDEQIVKAHHDVDMAAAELTDLTAAAEQARQDERDARVACDDLRARQHTAAVAAAACRPAAELEHAAHTAASQLAHLERSVAAARGEVAAAEHDFDWANQQHVAWKERAAEQRAAAAAMSSAQARVGITAAETSGDEQLETLQARFDALCVETSRLRTESGHQQALDEAERALADVQAEVGLIAAEVRSRAEQLAGTVDAASRTTVNAANVAAARSYDAAMRARAQADVEVTAAQTEVTALAPTGRTRHATLPDDWDVSDRANVEMYLTLTEEELAGIRSNQTRHQAAVATLDTQIEALRINVDRLTKLAIPHVAAAADDDVAAPAFAGTVDEAIDAAEQMRSELSVAHSAVTAAEQRRQEALFDVHRAAVDQTWAAVTSPIRVTCQQIGADELADVVVTYVSRAQARVRTVTDQLDALDTHRDLLVGELTDLCDTQRRMLLNVERASRLPATLGGELAGQPVFKIRFTPLAPHDITAALRAKVDMWAGELADGDEIKRDRRMQWLTDALRATVRPGANRSPWHVQVIKPTTDGHPEWHTADRIGKEYSGGQELTLAVLLYCTLAAVRGANRTTTRRPPGVLILDNPFGAASNAQLLRMQHELARGLGIQLVCATGLDDPNVLSSFNGDNGRVLRLTSDIARGTRYKHLRVDDPTAARHLAAQTTMSLDFDGTLTATGYTVKAQP